MPKHSYYIFSLLFYACCALGQRPTSYTFTRAKDSVFIAPPTETYQFTKGLVDQAVDLNADKRMDLIVYFGDCGNWGDCIYGFFVAEPSGNYRSVYEEYLPVFKISRSTTLVKNVHWKNITLFEKPENLPGIPHVKEKKLFFNGSSYSIK